MKNKQNFIKNVKEKINFKNKNILSRKYYCEKLVYSILIPFKDTVLRWLRLKHFNEKFKKILEDKMKKGYLQIIKFKSKLSLKKNEEFFYYKFRKIILKKKIRKYILSAIANTFFKKLKYRKKKLIKKTKKYNILNIYYFRKLLFSSLIALTNYRKYKLIKRKNNGIVLLKNLNFMKKIKKLKESSNYLKNKSIIVNVNTYIRE